MPREAPAQVAQSATAALLRGTFRMLSHLSPRVASRLAGEIFRRPRHFAAPQRELQLMRDAEPIGFTVGGTRIAAWRWGSGPAVLLVHGWEGRGSQMAPFAAPLVAAGFSVITFDAPGHGQSSGRTSSLPHFAWALRRVAQRAGDAYGVVAHSFGCAAATLAVRDGLPSEKLVFVAPPLNPREYVRKFGAMLGLSEPVIDALDARFEERFLRTWDDYSLTGSAPAMKAALLVLHDTDDAETPLAGGVRLSETWPRARLVTTSGLGHRRILRDREVIETATAFFAARN